MEDTTSALGATTGSATGEVIPAGELDQADRGEQAEAGPEDERIRLHPLGSDDLIGRRQPIPVRRMITGGLDTGKVQDHSALVMCEMTRYYLGLALDGETPSYIDDQGLYHPTEPRYKQRFRTVYTVRHIEHFPLETPYFVMADRIVDIFASLNVPADIRRVLTVEENAGAGIVEILRDKLKMRREVSDVLLNPIMTTAGRQQYYYGDRGCSKEYMVKHLLKLMGAEVPDLEVPADLEAFIPTFNELRNFQEKVAAESGNQSFAGKGGVHDDLVMALCFAVLVDPSMFEVRFSNRWY